MLLRGGGGVVSCTSRLLLRSTTRTAVQPKHLLRQLPGVLPHLHHNQRPHYHYQRYHGLSTSVGGLSSFETSANDGRYEQDVSVVRVDRDGTTGRQTTSIKELLLSTEVHVRDLIALLPTALTSRTTRPSPCILPRRDVIILVLNPLRLVITKDYVLAFDPDDPTVSHWLKQLAKSAKRHFKEGGYDMPDSPPFELRVLELALRRVAESFDRVTELLGLIVDTSLKNVSSNQTSEDSYLFALLPLKDGLALSQQHVQETIDMLVALLDNDEDMLSMQLTQAAQVAEQQEELDMSLHSEVELLLETYHRQLLLALHNLSIMRQRVQSAQEVLAIQVDLFRNRLLRMELFLAVVCTSLATCSAVASFFGMNLINGLEEDPHAFNHVVFGLGTFSGVMLMGSLFVMRMLQRNNDQYKLENIQAYQDVLKHIRSVSEALYLTANDPYDVEMGQSGAFRNHLRQLLSETRRHEVPYREVDIIMNVIDQSAKTLRERWNVSHGAPPEEVYRKFFNKGGRHHGAHPPINRTYDQEYGSKGKKKPTHRDPVDYE